MEASGDWRVVEGWTRYNLTIEWIVVDILELHIITGMKLYCIIFKSVI